MWCNRGYLFKGASLGRTGFSSGRHFTPFADRQSAMMRRLSVPLSRVATRAFCAESRGPRLHQPLGSVPDNTDLNSVRLKWGSDAMEKIQKTDVILVDGDVAICNGGGGALGHPIEYIKLFVSDEHAGPQVCKYCGLKFARKHHH